MLLISCSSNPDKKPGNDMSRADSDSLNYFVEYKNTVFCIPSPQLLVSLLQGIDTVQYTSILNPEDNADRYTTNFQKSINLGVYGADLLYLSRNRNSNFTLKYIRTIEKLSGELNLNDIFGNKLLLDLKKNSNNRDSLVKNLTEKYSIAIDYLRNNSREQSAALVAVGGWLEGFYLLTASYKIKGSNNENLRLLIVQQKYVLEFVIKVLAPYYSLSPEIAQLVDRLVDLAYDFEVIDVNYTYDDTVSVISGQSLKKNVETTVVSYSNNIGKIIDKVKTIRNGLVQ
jgi:hypothetical protein